MLQVGSDCELVLLYHDPIHFMEAQEDEFHRRFSSCWIQGEWFRCEGELKKFLENKINKEIKFEPILPAKVFERLRPKVKNSVFKRRRKAKIALYKTKRCFSGYSKGFVFNGLQCI